MMFQRIFHTRPRQLDFAVGQFGFHIPYLDVQTEIVKMYQYLFRITS